MTSSENNPSSHWLKRLGLGLIFVTAAMFLAFIVGAAVYSTLLSPSRGFAGGAEVFIAGIASALATGVLSAYFALRMAPEKLLIAAIGTFLSAVAVMAIIYFLSPGD